VAVQYHEFNIGHEITPEVLPLLHNFVVEVMPKSELKKFSK
jgi:predicted esterase